MKDFADVDNKLAAAQLAIGESSNLAQLCLTYTYNYDDPKYYEYACILSVLAQIAIDNAKRKFDIDLNAEIARIKNDIDIKTNGLPFFWLITKKDKRKARTAKEREERKKKNKERIKKSIKKELVCPMNKIYDIIIEPRKYTQDTMPMDKFWINHESDGSFKITKKIETLIQNFSIDLYNYNISDANDEEQYILLREDYENMITAIRKLTASKNNIGLFSWLINRAFLITQKMKNNKNKMLSKTNKNRVILLKTLYDVDKESFLKCFIGNTGQ